MVSQRQTDFAGGASVFLQKKFATIQDFFVFIKPPAVLVRLVIKEVEKMKGIGGRDWKVGICLSVITILGTAVLYLLYQNFLAEQMLYELNQDYEDVVKELEESK